MAFPFKTGGDFYNCEALRMALHNLGANPTETATGLIYFNTGASNLGKHAVVHDGTNFKALAFVDEIATNADFVELKEKVDLLIGDDVDTDTIIDSWKEVQAFLANIEDTKTLQGMLSSKVDKVSGKGLSTNDFTTELLNKLNGIAAGAEVNVQSDWNATSGDAFIKNKPTTLQGYGITDAYTITQANALYANYLPLSGGFMNNNASIKWNANVHSWDNAPDGLIGVSMVNDSLGYYGGLSFKGYYGIQIRAYGGDTDDISVRGYNASNWGTWRTIIHSGNVGEYALKKVANVSSLNAINAGEFFYSSFRPTNIPKGNYVGGVTLPTFQDAANDYRAQLAFSTEAECFVRRYMNGSWGNWKTIAFTDSDITGNAGSATKLQTARTIWGQSFDGMGNVSGALSGVTNINGAITINSSGNVGIGTTNPAYKLDVGGNSRVKSTRVGINTTQIGDSAIFEITGPNDDALFIGQQSNKDMWLQTAYKGNSNYPSQNHTYNLLLQPLGSNVLIGTPNELKSGAKLQVKGDLYVTGNIIADGEVSAGGAGQEGESGAGGAEVIDAPIPSGVTTYTIPNTIGRSAVAVSLYEANVINGQTIWSLCLADIEVTDSQITVTFGSATSVNHKLVAVG